MYEAKIKAGKLFGSEVNPIQLKCCLGIAPNVENCGLCAGFSLETSKLWMEAEEKLKTFEVEEGQYHWIELLSFPPITALKITGATIRKPYNFKFDADEKNGKLTNIKVI